MIHRNNSETGNYKSGYITYTKLYVGLVIISELNKIRDNKLTHAKTSRREEMAARIKGSEQYYKGAKLQLCVDSVDIEQHSNEYCHCRRRRRRRRRRSTHVVHVKKILRTIQTSKVTANMVMMHIINNTT